jgi:hypothetical protein
MITKHLYDFYDDMLLIKQSNFSYNKQTIFIYMHDVGMARERKLYIYEDSFSVAENVASFFVDHIKLCNEYWLVFKLEYKITFSATLKLAVNRFTKIFKFIISEKSLTEKNFNTKIKFTKIFWRRGVIDSIFQYLISCKVKI